MASAELTNLMLYGNDKKMKKGTVAGLDWVDSSKSKQRDRTKSINEKPRSKGLEGWEFRLFIIS